MFRSTVRGKAVALCFKDRGEFILSDSTLLSNSGELICAHENQKSWLRLRSDSDD